MSKKLEVGKTFIGHVKAKDSNNILLDFELLYGNALKPPINGKIGHLPVNKYNDMLREFLDSEEGSEYDIPTEEEVEQASIEILNNEMRILNSMRQSEPEQHAQPAAPKINIPRTNTPNVNTTIQEPATGHSDKSAVEKSEWTTTKKVETAKPDPEPEEDDYEDEEPEDIPEVKAYKKKLIPLIIVIAVQFIAICFLATIIVTRGTTTNTVEQEPTEEVDKQEDIINTETIIGKWKYDHTVVDYTEHLKALETSINAKADELIEEEYEAQLLALEEAKTTLVNETKTDENLKDSFYVFDDTGAFKTEGVKAQVTVMEQVSTMEADYEGAYVLDEVNKTLTLKANGTYLTSDIKYDYYVSSGTLSLTTNVDGVITHTVYTRVY